MSEYLKFWEEIVYKIILIIGLAAGGCTFFYRLRKRKQQEKILSQLAELRKEAVGIRNQGEELLSGDELKNWLEDVKIINKKIIKKTKEFDPVLGGFLETLDKLPRTFHKGFDPEQERDRDVLSERLIRVKEIIDKYYAPKSYTS